MVASAQGAGAANTAASSASASKWYVVGYNPAGASPTYQVIAGTLQQAQAIAGQAVNGTIAGPYSSLAAANAAIKAGTATGQPYSPPNPNLQNPITNWLSSIGGYIASGLEQGFVSLLTDLWQVIAGPILIVLGIAVAIVVLAIWFMSGDTGQSLLKSGAGALAGAAILAG
jgi:hypothetical protein